MPIQEDLAVPYHQQDTDFYCGAACAQMVLGSAGVGAGLLDQDNLYNDNHSHSTADVGVNWATGPDGLTWTMNDRRPPAFTNSFVLFPLASEDAISRKICWTIRHYHVAPIALVFGWAHWIVVRGYDASAAPSASSDTSYTITAFDVNNPWPPSPSFYTPADAPPPPHGAADGCGGGGDRGIANEHITYATWQTDYMTGVPGGHWAGDFIAVCDPEPPATRVGQQKPRPRGLRGDRLITGTVAAKYALSGIEEYGLPKREIWRKSLANARPGSPLLVQRLDRLDSYYYIVPMQQGEKRVSALLNVDARFGNYRQAVSVPDGGMDFIANIDRKAVLESVIGRKFDLGDKLGRLVVRPEALCLYSTLVWRPCRESLSPYWPFHMFTIGSQHIYVRVDGAVFTALHDSEPGI